jgi:UDP-N-acetylmuramoylalanine--D-glutamate ligase
LKYADSKGFVISLEPALSLLMLLLLIVLISNNTYLHYNRHNEIIFKNADKEEIIMHTSKLGLAGVHNLYNSMAAILAARAFEIRNEDIRDSLMSFKGVEHRLEKVREINKVLFINDSKATNVNSTYFALSSYHNPIIWIAGGRAKDNDYSSLDELVAKNVKLIVLIGEEKENIFNHFCLSKTCLKADSLEEAINFAYENASENEIVLFSPACKSFDMFLNFEDRGEKFKNIVNNL